MESPSLASSRWSGSDRIAADGNRCGLTPLIEAYAGRPRGR
jgi:hypothetical protein